MSRNPKLAERKKLAEAEIDPREECCVCGEEIGRRGKRVFAILNVDGKYEYQAHHMCAQHADELSVECEECGIRIMTDYYTALVGKDGREAIYCPKCRKNKLSFQCAACRTSFNDEVEPIHVEFDNVNVCPNCFEREVKTCHFCGRQSIHCADTYVNDSEDISAICSRCYEEYGGLAVCPGCGRVYPKATLTKRGNYLYCDHCKDSLNETCAHCGGPNMTANDFCQECRRIRVHEWDYNPPEIFGVGKKPWYGLELEITGFESEEVKTEASAAVWRSSDNESIVYQKHDGTINGGFELCFHPRSIQQWFNDDGQNILNRFTDIAREYGAYSYKGGYCGIHFHRCLTDLKTKEDRYKLLRAAISLEPFLYILAQRVGVAAVGEEGIANPRHYYGNFDLIKKIVGEHEIGPTDSDNWRKLVQKHRIAGEMEGIVFGRHGLNTVEIRIFRGTLKVYTILAYLSLYDHLVKWALWVDLDNLLNWNYTTAWQSFVEFVREQNADWSTHLLDYAATKGVRI